MGILFDVVLHGGTLLAILIYFREEWKIFTLGILRRFRGTSSEFERNLVDSIVVGTVPAVVVALVLRGPIEIYARRPLLTVITLILFGGLLWWADSRGTRNRSLASVSIRDGLLIGLAQALALVPGTSRSGVTITMALLLGFTRGESARYSFLLAGPIIALGALKGTQEMLVGPPDVVPHWIPVLGGILASFLVGYFCIKYFLRFLNRRSYLPFVVYRIALAFLILAVSFR
jgi:undecaprenyl-diphosphatase